MILIGYIEGIWAMFQHQLHRCNTSAHLLNLSYLHSMIDGRILSFYADVQLHAWQSIFVIK